MFPTTDKKLQSPKSHITINPYLLDVSNNRQEAVMAKSHITTNPYLSDVSNNRQKAAMAKSHIKTNPYLSDVSNNRQKAAIAKISYYNKSISVGCFQQLTNTPNTNFHIIENHHL